ncbi:hypothetical protein Poly41_38090 [Novipirellula artificiosorum]|uniref:Uncharacterized protein n=1 Tax=Novipirellula artificiosorum TaxID=2528016 RepID=A0A5C6DMB2_9BACT|nr:hypothetical protein Poly41_38090 [Novipirellula artificiosorum]
MLCPIKLLYFFLLAPKNLANQSLRLKELVTQSRSIQFPQGLLEEIDASVSVIAMEATHNE